MMAAMVAVAFVSACGNTADGVKKDAENAAEATAETAEKTAEKTSEAAANTGAAVDAAMETADVKTALIADTRVDASDINVDTNKDTKTVTIHGTVPTAAMKTLVGEVAVAKAVGFRVVNNLTIR
ncbi:MAG: BON domain-containing protein, partial [Gemmatimonadales bacterium]